MRSPLRDGDFELTFRRMQALPLFEDLTPRMEGRLRGKGGRGSVVLRRFRAGEVICRQGDPGWTAFYLVRNVDLVAIRTRHRARADAADAALAARAPELLGLPPAERRQRAEALEQGGGDAELAELLFTSAARPEEGELEATLAEQEIQAAGERADAQLEQRHPALLELDVGEKRRRAEAVAAGDPELAGLLEDSARAAEVRVRVEVAVVPQKKVVAPAPRGPLGRLRALVGREPRAAGTATVAERIVATLSEGELFGEMACLHHAPRSATVRAVRDCYAIELLVHVLEMLLDNKAFRADVDLAFRQRGLAPLLRGIPLLARASDEAIELLRRGAELVSYRPGEVLFDEGDPADSLYVVRGGTVKLSRRAPAASGDEQVLGYRSRGELLDERDFLAAGRRGATCRAYEHPRDPDDARASRRRAGAGRRVELVRIDRALWEAVCARSPAVRDEAARDPAPAPAPATTRTDSRAEALGLMQGRKLLLVDLRRCTACNECVTACAEVQPDGVPRLALRGPRAGDYLVPTSCRDCADPVCLVGCPVSAIHRGADGGVAIESFCVGCGLCAAQCPYGAIEVRALAAGDEEERRPVAAVCDQCAGIPGGPRCVSACAHDAALRVDARRFFAGTPTSSTRSA